MALVPWKICALPMETYSLCFSINRNLKMQDCDFVGYGFGSANVYLKKKVIRVFFKKVLWHLLVKIIIQTPTPPNDQSYHYEQMKAFVL